MWLNEETPIQKGDLILAKPFVNASGILGYVPDPHRMPFLSQLGAFITDPISRRTRKPASNCTCLPYTGGFLLHTGLPNPGVNRTIACYKRRWAGASLPIILHLLVENPEDAAEMIFKLEGLENVIAVELGLPPDCTPENLTEFMDAAVGELPVILSFNPEQICDLQEILSEIQPAALHLAEPRGTLPSPNGTLITGRLYGPAIFPTMLQATRFLLGTGHQLIVNGGLLNKIQQEILLGIGVMAIGLGSSLWQIEPFLSDEDL